MVLINAAAEVSLLISQHFLRIFDMDIASIGAASSSSIGTFDAPLPPQPPLSGGMQSTQRAAHPNLAAREGGSFNTLAPRVVALANLIGPKPAIAVVAAGGAVVGAPLVGCVGVALSFCSGAIGGSEVGISDHPTVEDVMTHALKAGAAGGATVVGVAGLCVAGVTHGVVSEVIGPSPANRAEETLSVAGVARWAVELLKAD
jgi:hypothetical protein